MPRRRSFWRTWVAAAVLVFFPVLAAERQTAGRLEPTESFPAARGLQVSQSNDEAGRVVEIAGPGAETYEMSLAAEGGVLLRFPGANLIMVPLEGEELAIPAALRAQDTLAFVSPEYRMSRLEARPSRLRVILSAVGLLSGGESKYRIGVGDKLSLDIYGEEEFGNEEMRVVEDGTVSVPYLGDVEVAGLTVGEAATRIAKNLATGYLVDPKVSLDVIAYESQWVHIPGGVRNPGRYYLKGRTRLVDILAEAGGFTDNAGTQIRIVRPTGVGGTEVVRSISRNDLYLSDRPEANPVLSSGETISISAQKHFFIKGQVKSPGRYALDEETTILRAISVAGGFEQYANRKKVELLRSTEVGTERLVINIEKIENRKAEDIPVLPGDIINVKAKFL